MDTTGLGDKMKGYEYITRAYMMRRMPCMIRLDGKSFSKLTQKLNKPFDEQFAKRMQETMKYLCENIGGVKIGYWQSDEITLLLTDYDTFNADPWFGKNIQKIVSVSASMASAKFNSIQDDLDLPLAVFNSRTWVLSKDEVCNCFL